MTRFLLIFALCLPVSAQTILAGVFDPQSPPASTMPSLVNFSGMPSTETAALGLATGAGSGCPNAPTDVFCAPTVDPSLSGNTLVVVYTYKAASGNTANTPTITSYKGGSGSAYSSTGDTYTHCGTDGNVSTNDTYIGCYYKIGATTGTSQIAVTWTAAVTQVAVGVYQLNNITAVDGYNSNSATGTTSWTTGSVTSTANNDIYLSCAIGTSTRTLVGSFTPGASFTLDLNDRRDAAVCQRQVQSSSGALNPAITAGTSNNYVGLTLAFKSGSAGTAPSGLYVAHVYRVSSATGGTSDLSYSIPSFAAGDLQVVTLSGGGATPQTITAVADTTNGIWTACNPPQTYDALSSIGAYFFPNSASGNLAVTLKHSGTGDIGPAVFYDVVGAASTQTCAAAYPYLNATGAGSTQTVMTGAVPAASSGIWIAATSQQNNTDLGSTVGTQDLATAGGQSLNGPSLPDENNGASHGYYSSNTPFNVTWNLLSSTQNVGVANSEILGFQASGATLYPVMVQATVNHATTAATTVSIEGVVSGTYTSGITATGSTGQTCGLLISNGGGTGATATVALTGTNTIAGSTALTITASGNSFTSNPTSATVFNGTATCTGTATIATTRGFTPIHAGDTLVVFVDANGITTGTISVSDGTNTYTAIDGPTNAGGYRSATFYAKNISGSGLTITATMTSNSQRSIMVEEFANTSTSAPLDTSAHNLVAVTSGSGGLITGTSVTTSYANEGLASFYLCSNTCSYSTGTNGSQQPWTQPGDDAEGNAFAFLSTGSTGTFTPLAIDSAGTGASDVAAIVGVH